MEIDCIHLDSNMEGIQNEYTEQSVSPCSSGMEDIFGDPEVHPRVGVEYQAEIPTTIAECDCLQLVNIPTNPEGMANKSFQLGLPIPLMWSNSEVENINGTLEYEHSEESQITSSNEYAELKVEAVDNLPGYRREMGLHSNLHLVTGGNKMEVNLVMSQEPETTMDLVERGLCPLPGTSGKLWTEIERDSFLLGLYIFGKNLIVVKRFVGIKEMGDVLSFYYGKFYRSDGYRRWSECRKLRSRRSIHGQKIFTGWRQQELLSRLFSHVSQECQSMLLEVSRTFGEGKITFEEYVFSLKSAVSVNMLIEAIGIGKGKQDLTGFAMEPAKTNHLISVRPEIPIGKACSFLSSADIIKLLTGDFRLSKARSSDLFWEAVWPRLLARGWHSEQPKDHGISGSKHTLVFLVPGVKKFSRRRLVKGNHYFDSVSDVLNKVASDPGLLELETEAAKGSQHAEEHGKDPSQKQDQKGFSKKRRHCYLQPRNSNANPNAQKLTIVDTSLAHGAERPTVRELRSLPVETSSVSTSSSLSSDSEQDTSEESEEEVEATNTLNPDEDMIDRRTSTESLECAHSHLNCSVPNASAPIVAAVENQENRSTFLITDKQQRNTKKHQCSWKVEPGRLKYLVPITKQQAFSACDHGKLGCSTKTMSADGKLNEDESQRKLNSTDACEDVVFQQGQNQNLLTASSLAKGSPDGSNEGIVSGNCLGRGLSPEKPKFPKSIDLNAHPVSSDFVAGSTMKEMAQNDDNSCVNESSFLPDTIQQPEPLKLPDVNAPLGQQPVMAIRRQSTRNRPLTTKALEALELGFFNTKKRKGSTMAESNSVSTSSRRVRGRIAVKETSCDGAGNNDADSRTVEILAGFQDNIDVVGESQV